MRMYTIFYLAILFSGAELDVARYTVRRDIFPVYTKL